MFDIREVELRIASLVALGNEVVEHILLLNMDNNMRRILAEDVHNLTTTLGMINTSIQTLDSQTDRIHLELVDKIIQGCEEILRGLQQYRKSTSSSPIERSRDPKRIHEDISQQNTSLLLVLDMLSKGSKEIPDIGAKDPYKSEVWDLGLNRPYNQLNNLSASEVNVTSFDPPSVSYLRTSPSVPVVESGDQFSAETQDMDLHQKIRKILSDFGFIEESLPKHHARLRWKNRHGKRLYDDYIEHEPGSIAAVQEYLNHFTINTKTTMASLKGSQNQPVSQYNQSPTTTAGSSQTYSSSATDITSQSSNSSNRATNNGFHTDIELGNPSDRGLFLFYTLERRGYPMELYHDRVDYIRDDRQLFQKLRWSYRKHRGRFRSIWSLRTLRSIHFMKFLYGPSYGDFRPHPEICIPGNPCRCIPPSTLVPPKGSKYDCRPIPAKLSPPIGPRLMMDLFRDPDSLKPGATLILQQVPKIRDNRPRCDVRYQEQDPDEGWGIYFAEDWDWVKIWTALGLFFFPPSLLFGVLWGILKKDVQGAFGIAGWWMTGATILIGIVGTRT